MTERSQTILRRTALAACLLTAVAYCVTVQLAGGGAASFLWYLVLTAALVFFPGAWLCGLLLPRVRGAGRIACAYVLGVALLWLYYAAFGTLASLTGLPLWLMFLPLLALAALNVASLARGYNAPHASSIVSVANDTDTHTTISNAQPAPHAPVQGAHGAPFLRRVKNQLAALSPTACFLLLCVCAGMLVYCFTGVLAFAHASAAGNLQYHQDMMWSVGNGAAASLGFPLRDLRTLGGTLHYHYLADAVPGLLAYAGGIVPYDAACYYNYPVLLFVLVCAAYAAARAYGAQTRHAAALPFALLFLQGFGSEVTLNILRNMNGVIAASALTCVMLFLLFWAEKQDFSSKNGVNIAFYVAFALCEGALLLSKNLYGILLFCAILAAVLVGGIVQRRFYRGALCMGLIGAALFGLLWAFLFRFAINNLVQEIWQSALAIPKTLLLWLPLGFVLYIVSLILSVRGFKTLSFGRLVVNAAVLGGLLAYFLFHHYSASQVYFILAAILFLWFCTLDILPLLFRTRVRLIRWAAYALAAVSLCGTLLTLLPVARTGVQVALRCLSLRPAYPYAADTVAPGDEAAALWLRKNMRSTDVFATNRNAKDMAVGEGTWHYYTAMSGRQAFVESWRYAMDYGMDYKTLRHNLEQVSDVIFAQETAEAAFALAKEYGIRYLLVSVPLKPEPLAGAQPVYENDVARIYEVI